MKLHAVSWHTLKGRGRIAAIKAGSLPPLIWDPKALIGTQVDIDGSIYTVKAVELFAIAYSVNSPYRLDFGILV